jgi:hypothetical protein
MYGTIFLILDGSAQKSVWANFSVEHRNELKIWFWWFQIMVYGMHIKKSKIKIFKSASVV